MSDFDNMDNEVIANNLDKLSQDIDEFKGILNSFGSHFDAVITHMNNLSSFWDDEAKDELMIRFNGDAQYVLGLKELLTEVYTNLVNAKDEYTKCEANVAGIIDSMSFGQGGGFR